MSYPRIKIAGILTTLSEMTVASGFAADFKPATKNEKDPPISHYSETCLDSANNPYLPASSLRGLLSSLSATQQSEHHTALFGDSEAKTAGKLRIYDATWAGNHWDKRQKDKPPKHLHTHNAIDPITGTAKDQHLYNDAFVPKNSQFDWLIEADQIDPAAVEYLFALLKGLTNNPLVQLGKGQSKQRGLFHWQAKNSHTPVQTLTQQSLINWLAEPENTGLNFADTDMQSATIAVNNTLLLSFPIVFTALSPILINDPSRVSGVSEEPDLEFYRNSAGQLIIPASSLSGVLRSQCRKILLTLMIANSEKMPQDDHSKENDTVDKLLAELFGSTAQQSKVWLNDAVAQDTKTSEHTQNFNAVDRFTGGVADGALYTAHAASPKIINSTLMIDTRRNTLGNSQ